MTTPTPSLDYRTAVPQLRHLATAELAAAPAQQGALGLEANLLTYGKAYQLSSALEEVFMPGCFSPLPDQLPLLLGHDVRSLPLGVVTEWFDGPQRLSARFRLADTAAAVEVYDLVRDGVVNACSIGFRSSNPASSGGDDGRDRYTHRRASLFEVSLVGVGAFDDATVSVSSPASVPSGSSAPSSSSVPSSGSSPATAPVAMRAATDVDEYQAQFRLLREQGELWSRIRSDIVVRDAERLLERARRGLVS